MTRDHVLWYRTASLLFIKVSFINVVSELNVPYVYKYTSTVKKLNDQPPRNHRQDQKK